MVLEGKTIVLGVSGGIAAYKACTLCSRLTQKGAGVRVVMTRSATKFVQPLTFQSLSRHQVYTDTFAEQDPSVIAHIDLADHADLILVAPATANIIGKLAGGIADDMLSTTLLATEAPIWMAPAMNGHMYAHPAVQDNMNKLKSWGVHFLEPGEGQLACGYVGRGRLAEPEQILERVERFFRDEQLPSAKNVQNRLAGQHAQWWQGKRLLVTAGPTREAIDPVRYLSNHSSGKMGYAVAETGAALGAEVTLVSGPTDLKDPPDIKVVRVTTTADMYQAVLNEFAKTDVVVKAAAVADYRPQHVSSQKIKKDEDRLQITLEKTEDILHALGQRKTDQILVGFAAETNDVEEHARQKMHKKNLDFIVANNVTEAGAGFGTETNIVTIFHRSGGKRALPLLKKEEVALELLKMVADYSG